MSTSAVILGGITIYIIGVILVIATLFGIRNKTKKKLETEINYLETEKNLIVSASIITELNKVKSLINNEKLEEKYNKWKETFDFIKDTELSRLTDMILDIETLVETNSFKEATFKIAETEIQIAYVKTNMEVLLESVKEITFSEERNRNAVTKLKSLYREIMTKFNKNRNDYKEVLNPIELQFENINKLFGAFEITMENSEYEEVGKIVKALDDLIKNIKIVIDEAPTISLLGKLIIPKKISDVSSIYIKMKKDGYNLDYLNLDYNKSEAEKKLSDIFDRLNVLNLEDSIFELKTMLDYFERLYVDFDQERSSKKFYERAIDTLREKLSRLTMIIKNIYVELDTLKVTYALSEEEISIVDGINKELNEAKDEYRLINDRTRTKSTPYSSLGKECELLSVKLFKIEDTLENTLKSLGSLKEDEARARDQLTEIRSILRNAKNKIKEYKLPVVPKNYFVELEESLEALNEINKELDKKPISIQILNTRVDTGRDLVLKVYNTSKELSKTAAMAEMAIVYANRYKSSVRELEVGINAAEKEFLKGEYRKSLEIVLNALNLVEPGIHKKLMASYQD